MSVCKTRSMWSLQNEMVLGDPDRYPSISCPCWGKGVIHSSTSQQAVGRAATPTGNRNLGDEKGQGVKLGTHISRR